MFETLRCGCTTYDFLGERTGLKVFFIRLLVRKFCLAVLIICKDDSSSSSEQLHSLTNAVFNFSVMSIAIFLAIPETVSFYFFMPYSQIG